MVDQRPTRKSRQNTLIRVFTVPLGRYVERTPSLGYMVSSFVPQPLVVSSVAHAIAQGTSYVNSEILQQCLHRSAQARCNESFLGILRPIPAHDTTLGNGDGLLFAQPARQGR